MSALSDSAGYRESLLPLFNFAFSESGKGVTSPSRVSVPSSAVKRLSDDLLGMPTSPWKKEAGKSQLMLLEGK